MVKRQARESIDAQKHQMIAALYANSAFDEDKKGPEERKKRIESFERHFDSAIEAIYHPERQASNEIDWDNPFWAAAKRARERQKAMIEGMRVNIDDNTTVDEVTEGQLQPPVTSADQLS